MEHWKGISTQNGPRFQPRCKNKSGYGFSRDWGSRLPSPLLPSRWVSLRCSHRILRFAWFFSFSIKVGGWQGLQGFGRAPGQHPSSPLAGHGRSSRTATNQGCGRTPRASSCLYSKHKLRTRDTALPRSLECPRLHTTPTWSLSTTCWSSNHLQKVQQSIGKIEWMASVRDDKIGNEMHLFRFVLWKQSCYVENVDFINCLL